MFLKSFLAKVKRPSEETEYWMTSKRKTVAIKQQYQESHLKITHFVSTGDSQAPSPLSAQHVATHSLMRQQSLKHHFGTWRPSGSILGKKNKNIDAAVTFFHCIYSPQFLGWSLNGFKWMETLFWNSFDRHGKQKMCIKGRGWPKTLWEKNNTKI